MNNESKSFYKNYSIHSDDAGYVKKELLKSPIDLRVPTGVYGKRKSNSILIVSKDKFGNYYVTQGTSKRNGEHLDIKTTVNFGADSIIDLENKLNGYHKLSRAANSRIRFV